MKLLNWKNGKKNVTEWRMMLSYIYERRRHTRDMSCVRDIAPLHMCSCRGGSGVNDQPMWPGSPGSCICRHHPWCIHKTISNKQCGLQQRDMQAISCRDPDKLQSSKTTTTTTQVHNAPQNFLPLSMAIDYISLCSSFLLNKSKYPANCATIITKIK